MVKKDFLIEVKIELDHIRIHATDKEKNKLDFTTFDHNSAIKCIYGQMTGNCGSERAKELYNKTYHSIGNQYYIKTEFKAMTFDSGCEYTALEKYLFLASTRLNNKSKKHGEVIEYIKGNLEEIVL